MTKENTNAIGGHLSTRIDETSFEHHQRQSPLLDRLPAEIRGAIYLEVWRTAGLSQHIFWHEDKTNPNNSKYCLWPCTTEFQVEDECERELEALWEKQGSIETINSPLWYARLQSRWYNHWPCEERLVDAYEQAGQPVHRMTDDQPRPPFNCPCRVNDKLPRKPYLPMMLSCKKIYHECISSIYESTTFIFLGEQTIQRFFGKCMESDAAANLLAPFFKSVHNLEVSLPITFPRDISCNSLSSEPQVHSAYDFHWLHLAEMENCHQVNIWIDARYRAPGGNPGGYYRDARGYTSITTLDADSLRSSVSTISNPRCKVVITTPLGEAVGPGYGFVDDIGNHRVHIWKRHIGDKFYPFPPGLGSVGKIRATCERMPFNNMGMRIYTCGRRSNGRVSGYLI